MAKAGYHDPRTGWNGEGQRQPDLARNNVASVAKKFLASGIEVVIDDVAFPDWETSRLSRWQTALAQVRLYSPFSCRIGALLLIEIPGERITPTPRKDAQKNLRRHDWVVRSIECDRHRHFESYGYGTGQTRLSACSERRDNGLVRYWYQRFLSLRRRKTYSLAKRSYRVLTLPLTMLASPLARNA